MRLTTAVSVWSLQGLALTGRMSLEQILAAISSMGVDAVEVNEDFLWLPEYGGLTGAARLRRQAQETGLRIVSIWSYTDVLGAVRVTSVEAVVGYIHERIALASALGCQFLTLTPGSGWPGVDVETGHGVFLDVFGSVIPIAKEYGVRVALEAGRSTGLFQTPMYVLRLVQEIGSDLLTLTPDTEAWRIPTEDLPIRHVERPGTRESTPLSVETFARCLPYAPYIHLKMLRLDDRGDEPHFPLTALLAAVRRSDRHHTLNIEYEGWIPDIDPHLDCVAETRRCVELVRSHLGVAATARVGA